MIPLSYKFNPEVVILGGGDIPTHPISINLLKSSQRIVCLDGATDTLLSMGMKPWRIIGDLDSLSSETRETYAHLIRYNPDQETNDQTKAITYLKEKGFKHIAILAATGKREDHTLANISLLAEYQKEGMDTRIYTNHGVFIPCRNNTSFQLPIKTPISIFATSQTKGMKSQGLLYPLRDFTAWWQGTLNTTISPNFTIECKGCYLVFASYNE